MENDVLSWVGSVFTALLVGVPWLPSTGNTDFAPMRGPHKLHTINSTAIMILLFMLAATSSRANYYVDAINGSDNNSGNLISDAFQTIDQAASRVSAGDTVFIREGIYTPPIFLSTPGTQSQRIVYTAWQDEEPVVDGSKSVGAWIHVSEEIYKAAAFFSVKPVIIENTPLYPVTTLQEMTEGTYSQQGDTLFVWCPDGGSPADHTIGIIKAFDGVWDESPAISIEGDYIDVNGLTIRFISEAGIVVSNVDNINISNCIVKFSREHGISVFDSWNSIVSGCTITNNSLSHFPRVEVGSGWGMGLSFFSGGNGRIVNNVVFENHGEGIGSLGWPGLSGTNGLEISSNVVYNNWSANIWLDHVSNALVDKNFSYVNDNAPSPNERRSRPSGILCAEEESFGVPGDLRNGIITNNVVLNCDAGFGFWFNTLGSGLRNFLVANNTFINCPSYAISIDAGVHEDSIFRNNIIFQNNHSMMSFAEPGNTVFDHNCWYNSGAEYVYEWNGQALNFDQWRSSTGQGTGSFLADPLLASGPTYMVSSYEVDINSPCINTGLAISSISDDFYGNPRPDGAGWDVGAFEFMHASLLGDHSRIPGGFSLFQNYPNPFNPSTTIAYFLSDDSIVSLTVFDGRGRLVKSLVTNQKEQAGLHRVSFNGERLSSGLYFSRLRVGDQSTTRKLLLVK